MSTFAFLVLCIQACLIFNVLSICSGAPYGSFGYGAPYGYGAGLAGPYNYGAGFGGLYGYGAGFGPFAGAYY